MGVRDIFAEWDLIDAWMRSDAARAYAGEWLTVDTSSGDVVVVQRGKRMRDVQEREPGHTICFVAECRRLDYPRPSTLLASPGGCWINPSM